ncbi:OmpH family outer membrane protein [Hymenobacter cheonanensis]|uniref:OmpH family outer membrane protein n=1 Tax=Hymenobacter sp. CA2-7 TaxID=3063993 RepID=UPI0027129163|nr:OmpH family outer membrane protein [Hymenobacter sp. CA2-7]MDO7888109.1 OmpH family outer membrane protein [Hymenobacter sp. CA2-7]
MKNPAQLAFNAVLLIAVAVLYFLHFNQRPAAVAAAAPVAATEEAAPAADTTAAASPAEAAPAAEQTPAVAAAPAGPAPAAGAIVYVESAKLLDGYQGMKDARRSFEGKAKGWERQNQALVSSFRTAVEQYQKTAAGLTPEQRAAAEQQLQQKQQQGAAEQQKIQQQAQEAEGKLTQTVLTSVNKKVEAYGKAHGYKMILIAAPSGTIAYGEKALDVTTPVLAYLNSEYRKK